MAAKVLRGDEKALRMEAFYLHPSIVVGWRLSTSTRCARVCGITVDRDGHVLVADSANNRVLRFRAGQSDGELFAGCHDQGQ